MSHPSAIGGSPKRQWPVILLIVVLVSAVSLALGLMVVGPIIQRREVESVRRVCGAVRRARHRNAGWDRNARAARLPDPRAGEAARLPRVPHSGTASPDRSAEAAPASLAA